MRATATIDTSDAAPATSAPLTVTADASDQSTIAKVVEGGGAAGDDTTYRIDVCPGDIGALNLTKVSISDSLPPGAIYVSSSPPATNVKTDSIPQLVEWYDVNVNVPDCDAYSVTVRYPTSDPSNVVGASNCSSTKTLIHPIW
jgi:hypothetical protein